MFKTAKLKSGLEICINFKPKNKKQIMSDFQKERFFEAIHKQVTYKKILI